MLQTAEAQQVFVSAFAADRASCQALSDPLAVHQISWSVVRVSKKAWTDSAKSI